MVLVKTKNIIEDSQNLTSTNSKYDNDIKEFHKNLETLRKSFQENQIPIERIKSIKNLTDQIQIKLKASESSCMEAEELFDELDVKIIERSGDYNVLLENFEKFSGNLNDFKGNVTEFQEYNVDGALNLTKSCVSQVNNTKPITLKINDMIIEIESTCQKINEILNNSTNLINNVTKNAVQIDLENTLEKFILEFNSNLPNMSQIICGEVGGPCHNRCGGIGCDSCGGFSCEKSALLISSNALAVAKNSEQLLEEKSSSNDKILANLAEIESNSDNIHTNGSENYKKIEDLYNSHDIIDIGGINANYQILNESTKILKDLERMAQITLDLDLNLDLNEIANLTDKINAIVLTLKNVDEIIANTTSDLKRVMELKKNGIVARVKANELLALTEDVLFDIDDADLALNSAKNATAVAQFEIKTAENLLDEVSESTSYIFSIVHP